MNLFVAHHGADIRTLRLQGRRIRRNSHLLVYASRFEGDIQCRRRTDQDFYAGPDGALKSRSRHRNVISSDVDVGDAIHALRSGFRLIQGARIRAANRYGSILDGCACAIHHRACDGSTI